jgi:hypothetical protein
VGSTSHNAVGFLVVIHKGDLRLQLESLLPLQFPPQDPSRLAIGSAASEAIVTEIHHVPGTNPKSAVQIRHVRR